MDIEECEKLFVRALQSKNEAEFCHLVDPLFHEYEVLSLELGRGSIYWRARVIKNGIFHELANLDYPPPEVSVRGRLNDEGDPFFYISANMETALAEVSPEDGELVQIAGFKIKDESPLALSVVGEYSNVQKNGYIHFLGTDPEQSIRNILNSLPRKEAIKKIYIDRFFAHVLRDPEASANNYLYSRALAQTILSKKYSEGIVFPSVKDRGGFNLGVMAKPSDRCFVNVCCVVAKVIAKRKFGLIEYELVNSAIELGAHEKFNWPEVYVPDTINLYNMTKDEYEADLRDPAKKFFSAKEVRHGD